MSFIRNACHIKCSSFKPKTVKFTLLYRALKTHCAAFSVAIKASIFILEVDSLSLFWLKKYFIAWFCILLFILKTKSVRGFGFFVVAERNKSFAFEKNEIIFLFIICLSLPS